jgi:hypothetical protein
LDSAPKPGIRAKIHALEQWVAKKFPPTGNREIFSVEPGINSA